MSIEYERQMPKSIHILEELLTLSICSTHILIFIFW